MTTNTGFYDSYQRLTLPKDTLTWTNLDTSPYATWDNWTTWYQNLTSSSTLALTTDIYDAGAAIDDVPQFTLNTRIDGYWRFPRWVGLLGFPTVIFDSGNEDRPTWLIKGSNSADMSSSSQITMTRTSAPNYVSIGSFRYWQVTVTIDAGTNTRPHGISGVKFDVSKQMMEEIVSGFDTSTVDDGTSATRTIPLVNSYSSIKYISVTPTTTITDNSGYVGSITSVPSIKVVETDTNSIGIQVYKPMSGDETDATVDVIVKGYPLVAINQYGNIWPILNKLI